MFPTVYAQTASKILSKNPTVGNIINKITENIISPTVSVLFMIAFVIFVYGMFELISGGGDPEKRKNGQNTIMWSVIGMVIMLSVYGIVRLISNTLGVDDPFI